MKPKNVLLMICLLLFLATGATASAPCTPDDGNNSRKDATPLEYMDKASGVVCPDDPYDFYVLKVAEGDNVSGSISFSSNQASTVLYIGHEESGQMLVNNKATTDEELRFVVEIPGGKLPPGTYYARVSFESGADYDHEYMLGIDLTILTRAELDDKFVTGKSPEFKTTNKFAFLRGQPWPMYRGDARRTGRSNFRGPMALAKVELVADLYDEFAPIPSPEDKYPGKRYYNFQGPLMRSPDTFYCIGYLKRIEELGFNKGYMLMFCSLSTGKVRKIQGNFNMETCLDLQGNIFRAGPSSVGKANFTHNDYNTIWNSDIPYYDTINYHEGYRYLTNLIGQRLYLFRGIIDGSFYITAFEYNGEVAWHSEKFNNPMIGMMEDLNGDLYVRVFGEGLYKLGSNGEILWNVLRQPAMYMPSGLAPTDRSGRVGPICGDDGRIWVSTGTISSAEYHVFNADGSEYKSGNFGANFYPRVCCYGHDGRFCVATSGFNVLCYNNWDEEAWKITLPGSNTMTNLKITIQDMVMDSKNMVYFLQHRCEPNAGTASVEVFAVNTNGYIVSSIVINLPIGAGEKNELAIGDENKLVLLNSGGLIYVISALQIEVGTFKEKFHMEARED